MIKNPYHLHGPDDVCVPVKLNFGDFILKKLLQFNEKPAVINGSSHETITFGRIGQEVMNFAVSLTRIGLQKGQVVAICSENRQEFWSAVIGVICAGGILSTVNIGYSKGEIKHVLSISKPCFIICSPLAYKNHEKVLKSLVYIKKIILFGDEQPNNTILFKDMTIPKNNVNKVVNSEIFSKNNTLARNVNYEEFEVPDVNGQTDVAFILYSSGTTGLPKGVMLTHMNVITNCCLKSTYDVEIIPLTIAPWYHAMGLMGGLQFLAVGRTVVYLPKFDVELYMETIERYKIPYLIVVPPVLVALSKSQVQRDLSSVQMITCGAAPLKRDTIKAVLVKFPNVQGVIQGYGMTECTLAVIKDTGEAKDAKPGGVGYVLEAITLKIVDLETRKPLGPNQNGEICVKGAMVMKGYIGKDRKEDFDEEGFLRTGDVGYYDDDKYLFIVDRLKELIKYKGYQVPPAEIESVLLQHEGVRDAGVVGVSHASGEEVPLAFIVPQPGWQLTETELKEFVAERLSNPKHLRGGVRFVNEIPKNPSGKILRRDLRKMVNSKKSKL